MEKKYSEKEIKDFTHGILKLKIRNKPREIFKQVILDNECYHYLISSYGRILSTKYRGFNKVHFMSPSKSNNGYMHISISLNGKSKTCSIHRLVALAFIPNMYNKPEVNHKNGIKIHNFVWNLEWVTRRENDEHAIINNLKTFRIGEEIGNNKFVTDDIVKVCKLIEDNKYSIKDISYQTGVTYDMVRNILNGKSWKHISENYDFSSYNYGKEYNFKENKIKKIHNICKMIEENKLSLKNIAEENNVSFSLVSQIYHRKKHTNISIKYNFKNFKTYKS